MIRLFTCWYDAGNPLRQAELEECLRRNLANPHIRQVVLWKDSGSVPVRESKLWVREEKRQPTFDNLFALASAVCARNDIAVIANSDIRFDDTVALAGNLGSNECYALLRWEENHKLFSSEDGPRDDSQDAWFFRAPIPLVGADFSPGRPRCDNGLAYRLWRLGFDLRNPAKSIHIHHLHASSVRNYDSKKYRVPRPWLHLEPTALDVRGRMTLLHKKFSSKKKVGPCFQSGPFAHFEDVRPSRQRLERGAFSVAGGGKSF